MSLPHSASALGATREVATVPARMPRQCAGRLDDHRDDRCPCADQCIFVLSVLLLNPPPAGAVVGIQVRSINKVPGGSVDFPRRAKSQLPPLTPETARTMSKVIIRLRGTTGNLRTGQLDKIRTALGHMGSQWPPGAATR